MKKRGALWLPVLLCCGLLALLPGRSASAAVFSTAEAAGGPDSVYVAGNPDWYPVEYYNKDTGCYEGILPEILEGISEETGLNFTYIRAGEEDQRLRLARNAQVEMVSGYGLDREELEDYGMTASRVLLTTELGGQTVEVCFAFTDIASDELIASVEGALAEISGEEIAGLAAALAADQSAPSVPIWAAAAALGVFVALAALLVVLALRLRRYKRMADREEQYDIVTGIGNKAYFAQRFEKYIPDAYRGIYCVVFIGFDITRVNQHYGEAEAEEQLRFAANELMLSTADNEIAARVSGGGFAVARPSSGEAEAETWTKALLGRLNSYMERYGKDYRPEFHGGIYMLQSSDRDCETALFNARQGYQLAVNSGAAYAFSRAEHLARESESLQLKRQMLEAIEKREFKMFLQFVVRGADGEIVSAEALSRWDHPQKGLLYPGSYIHLMESENTIAELDCYIFEEACRRLEKWQGKGWGISISCNFTRVTIDNEDFIPRLRRIADSYDFDRSKLVIEITEDAMENNKRIAFENVSQCKAMGFRVALDDVGSGYSSFSDLRDYPIDLIKIDRSILNSAVNQRGIALLKGMIALGRSLQIKVLCEGVETEQQADLLRQLSCDYMQGYYFYRALPAEEAERFLRERSGNAEES